IPVLKSSRVIFAPVGGSLQHLVRFFVVSLEIRVAVRSAVACHNHVAVRREKSHLDDQFSRRAGKASCAFEKNLGAGSTISVSSAKLVENCGLKRQSRWKRLPRYLAES